MTIFALKLIAIITMLIDHTGAVLLSPDTQLYWMARTIGRIAFPIFVFMLVEGFHHTSNIRKYLTRMGIFALISEIPFDIAFYNSISGRDFLYDFKASFSSPTVLNVFLKNLLSHQNVFFTLFLGLLAIYCMSMIENRFKKDILLSNLFDALVTIGFCAAAVLLRTDYDMKGILLIVAFYLFRGSKIVTTVCLIIIIGTFFPSTKDNLNIQTFSLLAMVPIAFYKGKKGKNIKYFFYIFYPAHLLILWLISVFI
jgi:hypothetical protein